MRKWIDLFEKVEPRLSMNDLIDELGLRPFKDRFHDFTLPWLNDTRPGCIQRAIKVPEFRMLSKLMFWHQYIVGDGQRYGRFSSYATPVGTVADFEHALSTPITIWRAGGGTYNPDLYRRGWVSFTANERRIETFSKYHATYATRAWKLPERKGLWWVIELTLPLDDILLFLPHGQDDEVIISRKDAKRATVKETGGEKITDWGEAARDLLTP